MFLTDIKNIVKHDFDETQNIILNTLSTDLVKLDNICDYILHTGGKKIRPLIVLLIAHACKYKEKNHLIIAAVIELIHTATLVHDDVIDNSDLRRTNKTINAIWDNSISILTGDFLYSSAFSLISNIKNMDIIKIFAEVSKKITEGEIAQMLDRHNYNLSINEYMKIIKNKTATLFEAACSTMGIIANVDSNMQRCLSIYGEKFGIAFQIINDIKDYTIDNNNDEKKIGSDLYEGKMTLPLILAKNNCNINENKIIEDAIINGNTKNINLIFDIIIKYETIEKSYNIARLNIELAKKALISLSDSIYKQALLNLANIIIN
jgi:octaprenyl-diphosphate synthase